MPTKLTKQEREQKEFEALSAKETPITVNFAGRTIMFFKNSTWRTPPKLSRQSSKRKKSEGESSR